MTLTKTADDKMCRDGNKDVFLSIFDSMLQFSKEIIQSSQRGGQCCGTVDFLASFTPNGSTVYKINTKL